jgi:glycosyltransferase involved in cell wall biosynthesis
MRAAVQQNRTSDRENIPTVSVIIPAYNCPEYVSAAMDSVFKQTFKNFEVILINDGSPDTERLDHFVAPYRDRIIYLKQANRGAAAARNTGIGASRGEYLAFLDSDDCWPPEYLSAQMRLFEENNLDLVYADALLFGDIRLHRNKTFISASNPRLTSFEDLLVQGCQIIPSATVVRKQVVTDAGLFDETLRGSEDYDLWLRLLHRGARIAHQPTVSALRRVHADALTKDVDKMLEDEERVLSKLNRTLQLSDEARSLLLSRHIPIKADVCLEKGKRCLFSGESRQAQEYLESAYTLFCQENSLPIVLSNRYVPALHRAAKLRVLLWGLRTVPRVTTFGARMWENSLLALQALKARSHK